MSWLDPPSADQGSWAGRLLLALLGRRARESESVRLWARSPRAFAWFLGLHRALDRPASPVEPRLRSLVMLRVAQRSGCASCVDRNATRAGLRGVPGQKLAALDRHAASPLFDARERAALALVDAVVPGGSGPGTEVRAALRSEFSPDAIVELAALVAYQRMSSTFNTVLDAAPDGACTAPGCAPGSGDGAP